MAAEFKTMDIRMCSNDEMGLGKTIQVIKFLHEIRL